MMRNFNVYAASGLAAACLLLISSVSSAEQCYRKSPNLLKEGDNYYAIEAAGDLSSRDQKTVARIFDSMKGDWEGKGIVTECHGSMSAPSVEENHLELEASIESGSKGEVVIRYEARNREREKTSIETLKLSTANRNQSFSTAGSGLIITEKYRIKNVNSGTRLRETVYEIATGKGSLQMHISRYTNGYLGSQESWSLTR